MTFEELCAALGIEPTDENKTALTTFATAREAPLKANRDSLLADNKRLKTAAAAYTGIDAEELTAVLTELSIEPADIAARLRDAPKVGADAAAAATAAAEARLGRKLTLAEKRAVDAEAKATKSERALCDAEARRELMDEIVKKKGNPALLLPVLKGRVRSTVDPETGLVTLTPLAANGDEMLSATGAPGTISDLVESLRLNETFGVAFEADGGGSGAVGSTNKPGSRVSNPWIKGDNFSLTEQSRIKRDKPALAETLQREAKRAA